MAEHASKIAAIFSNHQALKDALDDLNEAGFNRDEISVLVKRQPDSTTEIEPLDNEVRTYSTATYPGVSETTAKRLERRDTGSYATQMRDRDYVRPFGYTPPADPYIDVYDRPNVVNGEIVQRELVDDVVEKNRLDKHLKEEHEVQIKDPNALISDSIKGGAWGALVGAIALLIPGVGPVFAAGPIAAAVSALATGAAMGTTAGALVGLFGDEGIPHDKVEMYRRAFEAGKAVVIFKPKNTQGETTELSLVRSLLKRHHPETLEMI